MQLNKFFTEFINISYIQPFEKNELIDKELIRFAVVNCVKHRKLKSFDKKIDLPNNESPKFYFKTNAKNVEATIERFFGKKQSINL